MGNLKPLPLRVFCLIIPLQVSLLLLIIPIRVFYLKCALAGLLFYIFPCGSLCFPFRVFVLFLCVFLIFYIVPCGSYFLIFALRLSWTCVLVPCCTRTVKAPSPQPSPMKIFQQTLLHTIGFFNLIYLFTSWLQDTWHQPPQFHVKPLKKVPSAERYPIRLRHYLAVFCSCLGLS